MKGKKIDEFPYVLRIEKIMPPQDLDDMYMARAYLIKIKSRLICPHIFNKKDFEFFIRKVKESKMFYDVWTPEISNIKEIDGMPEVEMISYIRQGMEKKVLIMDKLARISSGKLKKVSKKMDEDSIMVKEFVKEIKSGSELRKAISEAKNRTRRILREKGAEAEIEMDEEIFISLKNGKVKSEVEKRVIMRSEKKDKRKMIAEEKGMELEFSVDATEIPINTRKRRN